MTDHKTITTVTDEPVSRSMPTQAFGLALIAGAFAVLFLSMLLFGSAGEAMAGAAFTLVAALLAWMVWRVDRLWAKIVGLVVTILAGLGLWWFVFGVFQPFSPFEFIAGILFLLGIVFALVGGIGALRRRSRDAGPGKTGMRARKTALVVIAVGAVMSIGGFLLNRTTVDAAEAADASAMDMVDFEFVPAVASVDAGQKLLLTNSDVFAHDFTLDQFDIYVNIGPGSETIVDLGELSPGTYQFYCSLHSDGTDGMAGAITVSG